MTSGSLSPKKGRVHLHIIVKTFISRYRNPDPGRVSEGFEKGVSEGVFEGVSEGFSEGFSKGFTRALEGF